MAAWEGPLVSQVSVPLWSTARDMTEPCGIGAFSLVAKLDYGVPLQLLRETRRIGCVCLVVSIHQSASTRNMASLEFLTATNR